MAHLGYQPGHGLGANLQGPLHLIREPYQFGKEGLSYEGESGIRTPLTWTLRTHFVQGLLNPGESSRESSDSESSTEYDSESEEDLVDVWELTSAFDWLFFHDQQSSEFQDPIFLIEDQTIGQSDQATDQQISIHAGFPQSVLILDQNFPFSMIIPIDGVPRPVSPVIIFLPFSEDRLWRARLDTIRCVPSIPNQ